MESKPDEQAQRKVSFKLVGHVVMAMKVRGDVLAYRADTVSDGNCAKWRPSNLLRRPAALSSGVEPSIQLRQAACISDDAAGKRVRDSSHYDDRQGVHPDALRCRSNCSTQVPVT